MEIQITDIACNSDYYSPPAMLLINIDEAVIAKAKKAAAFMNENDIGYMCMWYVAGYTVYENADDLSPEHNPDIEIFTTHDGAKYYESDPEYRIEGCHIKVYKDGDMQAVLPLKYNNEELWCDLGSVDKFGGL